MTVNLLDSSENVFSKFATKNGTLLTVKQKETIHKSNQIFNKLNKIKCLCDDSDAYILVSGNIAVKNVYEY